MCCKLMTLDSAELRRVFGPFVNLLLIEFAPKRDSTLRNVRRQIVAIRVWCVMPSVNCGQASLTQKKFTGGRMSTGIAAALKRQSKRVVATAILASTIVAFHLANIPEKADFSLIKYPYAFSRHSLPEVPGPERRSFRPMHPDLHHITAFMSTLGSGAAFADIDGDGLPNDVCYVDTVTDQVIVAPAPGTPDRYKPFALDANLGGKTLFTRTTMGPMGCVPADVNEDGRIDLLVYYVGRTPLVF